MSTADVAKDIEQALDGVHRDAEIEKLKACLMVLDATIYCLLPFATRPRRLPTRRRPARSQ